ncbi:hypothetical protein MPSEU_000337000 [Mayamaea pseudoterrestris]|nr:hypothetical protein MPSEU_000337000 [Mayamaea pseudoterrestris]
MVHRHPQSQDPFCSRLFGHFPSTTAPPAPKNTSSQAMTRVRDLVLPPYPEQSHYSQFKVPSYSTLNTIPTFDLWSPPKKSDERHHNQQQRRNSLPKPPLSPDKGRASRQMERSESRQQSRGRFSHKESPRSCSLVPQKLESNDNKHADMRLNVSRHVPSRRHSYMAGDTSYPRVEEQQLDLESRLRRREASILRGRPPRRPHGEI